MSWSMFALALVLGLDIFAGAISLGLQGLKRAQWARTAALFAVLAFLMTVSGVLLGRVLGDRLGGHAAYFAGVLLAVLGVRAILDATIGHDDNAAPAPNAIPFAGVLTIGFIICMDKFAAGLTLSNLDQSLTGFMAYLTIQTFFVSLAGFALGGRLGSKVGEYAEIIAGGIFILLGALIVYQTWVGKDLLS